MVMLLIAGVGAIVAGGLAIWFGIPVKEFSFGNTMILAGVVGVCTGLLLIGLAFVVRELRAIANRLRSAESAGERLRSINAPPLPAGSIAGGRHVPVGGGSRDPFSETGAEAAARPSSQIPPNATAWRDEGRARAGVADAGGQPAPEPVPAPPEKPRRNLLFTSSVRKDRDQPLVPTADLEPEKVRPSADAVKPEPHPSFDDAWPKGDRSRRDVGATRGSRSSSTTEGVSPAAPPAPDVVVVKSGVVDGMAYSLYSDGSIEAQMPEGMTRFASIDELRNHLDQRS
jgi:hypothetical protein